jgi:hypothetical protein
MIAASPNDWAPTPLLDLPTRWEVAVATVPSTRRACSLSKSGVGRFSKRARLSLFGVSIFQVLSER